MHHFQFDFVRCTDLRKMSQIKVVCPIKRYTLSYASAFALEYFAEESYKSVARRNYTGTT
jgi:hypothetical protein